MLDFGLSDRTCAVMDLALAIRRNTVDWMAPADARRVDMRRSMRCSTGTTARTAGRQAYAALVALLPIVHTEFAMSEVAYFGCIIDAPAIVDIAYDGYLIGHARWFGERDGRQLLDWLARRRVKQGLPDSPAGIAAHVCRFPVLPPSSVRPSRRTFIEFS